MKFLLNDLSISVLPFKTFIWHPSNVRDWDKFKLGLTGEVLFTKRG